MLVVGLIVWAAMSCVIGAVFGRAIDNLQD